MIEEFNLVITGVGGQGSILISELLGKAALRSGLHVKGSETIGIAQRGAPVVGMLRMGSAPLGPTVPHGRGDLMIAMESVEALRSISLMAKSSVIVLSTQRVVPTTVLLGDSCYPGHEEIISKLRKNSARIAIVDAVRLAREAGSATSANIVMLGAAFGTGLLPIEMTTIVTLLKARFSGKAGESNIKALDLGYHAALQASGNLTARQDTPAGE